MRLESATGSVVPRYLLGRHLRELREAASLSLRQAGLKLEMSASTVSRLENGESPVRSLDVEQACKVYGVDDAELIRALMDLAKETRATKAKNWLSSYADLVSDNFVLFTGLEASTSSLALYETDLIPGLLQTLEYAKSIMGDERFTGTQLDPDVLERRLEIRLNRQLILDRESGPPKLDVVLSEAVVRRRIGGAETMAGQLIHLLEMAQRPDIAIRIMPLDVEEHAGLTTGPFALLDFPPRGPLVERSGVYVDGFLGFFWADKPDEVGLLQKAWANLWEIALSDEESADFIKQRLNELQQLA
ncbi:helix-turn-helix domain-containing protein [Kribbella sp. NBC_01484]|uniref:helix-turn-helix domain-containing protein n=1 Tax=Kribbella sp. NBC_01484 TaxID=2903579 RepID=UPI002E370FD2|nr:helix-turn-helix transcriptional regulator [Kribbella sp. NBC_01484]